MMSVIVRVLSLLIAAALALLFRSAFFDGSDPIQRSEMTDEWVVYRMEAAPGTFRVYNSPGDSLHPPRMDSLRFRMPDSSVVRVTVRWDLPTAP
jgi:hypothetical protein